MPLESRQADVTARPKLWIATGRLDPDCLNAMARWPCGPTTPFWATLFVKTMGRCYLTSDTVLEGRKFFPKPHKPRLPSNREDTALGKNNHD